MRTICKISNIITATLLTAIGLLKLIPSQSSIGLLIQCLIVKITTNNILSTIVSLVLIFLGIIMLFSMVYDLKREKKRHTFKVGSKGFCSFFAKWYSQPGMLSIICDDLEGWINPNNNSTILDALKTKSQRNELHLFLGKKSPPDIVAELELLGAIIRMAPTDIISNYSFSCLSVMGNYSAVIIRNKQLDKSTKIVFEEISNSYISGLLNTLIREGKISE